MANLAYCRFRNTLGDLSDCLDHLTDELDDTEAAEHNARAQLIELCQEIVEIAEDDESLLERKRSYECY